MFMPSRNRLSSSNLQIQFILSSSNNLHMEDSCHQKEQTFRCSKEKSVVSLSLEDSKQKSEKFQLLKNEARKTLFSESLFSQKDRNQCPKEARKTSINDYETKSLKDHELRGSVSRTTFYCRRPQNQESRRQDPSNHYNQNLFRLKVEEMTFKFKTKIGMLLRQMNISVTELSKFTELNKIDEILDFLGEKVKEMIRQNQVRTSASEKGKNKDLEIINQYEIQMEALKKRIIDRENAQKGYKERLKEAHHEIRELYDKISRKQKQLSTKRTEIYQIKTIKSQSDKLISTLSQKCFNIEKEYIQLQEVHTSQTKKLHAEMRALQQSNQELREKIEELVEVNQRLSEKQDQILEINIQLNEELQRWRERFETQGICPQRLSQQHTIPSKDLVTAQTIDLKEDNLYEGGKYSQLALLNQNSRLAFKISELERQNKDLSHELTLIGNLKVKYDELRTCLKNAETIQSPSQISSNSQKNRSSPRESFIFEIEENYKKKIEENAKQWRQKLVDIVNTYEQQIESNKMEIKRLIRNEQELQAKIHQLANQKYQVQSLLIEKEREIYELARNNRDSCRVINSIELAQPVQYKNPDWEVELPNYQVSITSKQDPSK